MSRTAIKLGGALLLLSLLEACNQNRFEPYYTGDAPQLSGVSQNTEDGNVGGDVITISGAGFGADPNRVSVVFGSTNAKILSVQDDRIEIVVPRGPLEGGPVDIVVGTPGGQSDNPDAVYYYNMAPGAGNNPFADQVAYLAVTNDWFSCIGGLGRTDDPAYAPFPSLIVGSPREPLAGDAKALLEDNPDHQFCGLDSFSAPFTGLSGTAGRAEIIEFAYPRLHNVFAGERVGYGGSWDISWEKWRVETPAQEVVSVDVEGAYKSLRTELGRVSIDNLSVRDSGINSEFCLDKSALGTFTAYSEKLASYRDGNGGVIPLHGDRYNSVPDACDSGEGLRYDRSELNLCQSDDYDNTRSYRWEADWPVGDNFFKGTDGDGELSDVGDVHIAVNVASAGIQGTELLLPPPLLAEGKDAVDGVAPSSLFFFSGPTGANCPEEDADGNADGSSPFAYVVWDHAQVGLDDQPNNGQGVKHVQSWVRMTIQHLPLGWLGPSPGTLKATITVPDKWNEVSEGRSRLEIPAWVMYQFPSVDFGPTDTYPSGAPELAETAYLVLTIERVTEYVLEAPSLSGDLVFAYSTGDIGFTYLNNAWANGLELGSCGDCVDGDGDGWKDLDDPDCADAVGEEDNHRFGASSCNDGLDNDGDGNIDSEDPKCTSASSSEDTCHDRLDNDEDGWIDSGDPDCDDGPDEVGLSDLGCNDGIDNDGDGRTDGRDSDCGRAEHIEDDNCRDNIDNDGDGWEDEFDPDCPDDGSDGLESTFDTYDTTCSDGVDNDGDGWVDRDDLACTAPELEEDDGFTGSECNDNLDNDGHGDIDAADPTCQRQGPTGVESPAMVADCDDGEDDDGDGYVDSDDPDCEDPPYNGETVAFLDPAIEDGVPACYNGLDDDLDGDVDAADSDCLTGFDRAEDPSRAGCTDGADNDGDGWFDLDDPDCAFGADEVGLGVSECNDGVDNDADGAVDADDGGCVDANDVSEAG